MNTPQIHPPPQCPSHFCCLSLPNQAWGPTLPNLVTLGYLHPSPPTHWTTIPLSAAQGECACRQRAGPVHGPPPSLIPLASQDLWMGGESSAGCSARVYWERWDLAKVCLSKGAVKHKSVGTLRFSPASLAWRFCGSELLRHPVPALSALVHQQSPLF